MFYGGSKDSVRLLWLLDILISFLGCSKTGRIIGILLLQYGDILHEEKEEGRRTSTGADAKEKEAHTPKTLLSRLWVVSQKAFPGTNIYDCK